MARAADRRTTREPAASDGDACDGVCPTLHRRGHRARRAQRRPLLGVVRAGGWRRLLGGNPFFVGCREPYRLEWWCREPQRDDPLALDALTGWGLC